MTAFTKRWQASNQQHLAMALRPVRQCLESYVAQLQDTTEGTASTFVAESTAEDAPDDDRDSDSPSSALEYLCQAFDLTAFEQQVLLLCAGVELSGAIAQLCATAQGHPQFNYPTFSLALAIFPSAEWAAITPVATLRRWQLIEVVNPDRLTQSRVHINERILHYLTGATYLDPHLQGIIRPVAAPAHIVPSHGELAQRLVSLWTLSPPTLPPAIQLCGKAAEGCALAAIACRHLTVGLYRLRVSDIPPLTTDRETLARLWEREALLGQGVLLIDGSDSSPTTRQQAVLPFLESLGTQWILVGMPPLEIRDRPLVHLDIPPSTWAEQRLLWQQALSPQGEPLNGQLDGLVSQFHLSAATIQSVCAEVLNHSQAATSLEDQLWDTCRLQTRPQLDTLAQAIVPKASWQELVLPEREHQTLQEMAAQVRQQAKVYDTWAFATQGSQGVGISALFAGPSGTGKTLAAEVLAHELRLNLYRIDLSQVVSKYIGETEKNLSQVFDAAETGGAILLFDEADALFGKRSDVKDARDRYANIEVSYLLQRMETYRGLAILTTNLKKSIDPAFLRRLRFVVQFPFPKPAQRLEIWQRIFPSQLPTDALDFDQLAQLNITGGNIRNIALNAAFLAADEDGPVQMRHLLRAAKTEYSKLEKTLTDTEMRGWG